MKKRFVFLGFALLILALNLQSCRTTANPIGDTVQIEVQISSRTPLGKELIQNKGDDPQIRICKGCTDLRYRSITAPEDIARLSAFVNQRLGFWKNSYGMPFSEVKLRFYDAQYNYTGTFDISRGGYYGGSRTANRHEIKELMGYLDINSRHIWDSERARKWLRITP